MQLQAQTEQGTQLLTVQEVEDDTVKLDANHPLAGTTLNFDVTVREVREATAQEVEDGKPAE
jgi:FKBP-type peptidyl-prolyl cis-trans isomerase SlyD